MKQTTTEYINGLRELQARKKELMQQLNSQNREVVANQKRMAREEHRLMKEQWNEMQMADKDIQKELYGSADKRERNLFNRKEKDELYQLYSTQAEKAQIAADDLKLELDLLRQDEKYLFKEIDLYTADLQHVHIETTQG